MAASAVPRSARTLREDELEELAHRLRRELEDRGERLPADWTSTAVADLRTGRLAGWAVPSGPGVGSLGFYSRRGRRAFGHVHVLEGDDRVPRALALLGRMGDDPELNGLPLTLGVTGLGPEEEAELAALWRARPGRHAVAREGLERTLDDPALWASIPTPEGVELVGADRITSAALADLDLRGFRGSLDAQLFGGDPSENARMIEEITSGGLGRFLPEASAGLLDGDGRLIGMLLTAEISPRVGLFADFVVDPSARRRGLGRWLMRWGLRALRALGHERGRLWVTERNEAARALYASLGFVRYARAMVYLQDGAIGVAQPHPGA